MIKQHALLQVLPNNLLHRIGVPLRSTPTGE
jgi:hypothetical protein